MYYALVSVPGQPPRKVILDKPVTSIGRSSINDLAVSDKMLSRQHARVVRDGGSLFVEDLGSRNGTLVNGERISSPHTLSPGDEITLGTVAIRIESDATTRVRIEKTATDPLDNTILKASVETLRSSGRQPTDPRLPAEQMAKLVESLRVVNEMTLELIHDIPVDELLRLLMDKVFAFLSPDRGAVLLRREDGTLSPEIVRVADGLSRDEIRLSQTLVNAVVERRQGLLLIDTGADKQIARAESIRLAGVKSVLAAPLENEGEVVGLIYVDSQVGHRSFTEDDLRLLTSLANVAAAKIQNARLEVEAQEKRAMDREITLARQIQEKLLPEEPPEIEGFLLYGSNFPSRQISGDLYDFCVRPDGKIYVAIADVCGKGIGPALLMASLQASLGIWADEELAVADMTARLSASLAKRTSSGRFITFFLVLLDPPTGEIQFTNAGHNPGLLVRVNGEVECLGSHGLPLALFPGRPYGQESRTLAPGDLLFLYTDGITEANDPEGNEYGLDRLTEVVKRLRTSDPRDLEHGLDEDLHQYAAGTPFHDDRTLIILRRR
jgi:phosphoserine phosphatase RsbU/P